MDIKFFIPRWGNRDLSWNDLAVKAKTDGYNGVECGLPTDENEQADMFSAFQKNGLSWIGQHFETCTADFEEHCKQYETRLNQLASAKPIFINSQTGKDFFSLEQNSKLIEIATKVSEKTGVATIHETHRGKFSFCTSATAPYLHKYPELKLTADFSHWCCVAESYLQDQKEILDLAVSRSNHFHARVGFPGGAQINNPAAPEWQEALAFHCVWWDAIVQHHLALKSETLTITCEFGPFPYMPQLPFSKEDVSSLWDANLFMKNLLQKRYADLK